jgi:hypothetical protein
LLKNLKINLMLKMFYGLMLELLELFFKNYLVIVAFFFLSNLWCQNFGKMIIVYIFLWIALFLRKKTLKKSPSYENFPPNVFYRKCWLMGLLIELFNARISPIFVFFYFYIGNENKIIIISCDFFFSNFHN